MGKKVGSRKEKMKENLEKFRAEQCPYNIVFKPCACY